jgi:hypothetical protein
MSASGTGTFATMNAIERLIKSYGYVVSRVPGWIKRVDKSTWQILKLVRLDGTPGPQVTLRRSVDGKWIWERRLPARADANAASSDAANPDTSVNRAE